MTVLFALSFYKHILSFTDFELHNDRVFPVISEWAFT